MAASAGRVATPHDFLHALTHEHQVWASGQSNSIEAALGRDVPGLHELVLSRMATAERFFPGRVEWLRCEQTPLAALLSIRFHVEARPDLWLTWSGLAVLAGGSALVEVEAWRWGRRAP